VQESAILRVASLALTRSLALDSRSVGVAGVDTLPVIGTH